MSGVTAIYLLRNKFGRTIELGILALVVICGFGLSPRASAQNLPYCYGGTCFEKLSEAEAAMKGASQYGNLLRPNGKGAISQNGTYVLNYTVDDQEPIRFWTTYAMPSVESSQACAAGNPLRPNSCGTEEESASLYWNSPNAYKPAQCVLGTPTIGGEYISPYRYAVEKSIAGVSYGEFRSNDLVGGTYLQPSHTFRRMQYSVVCPGVEPRIMAYSLDKSVAYQCPANFRATAVNPADPKPPIYGTKWCKPTGAMPYITAKVRQFETCPVNAHPCFPGTGDKMRVEPDFEVSGWQFARIYHSLAELDGGAISSGWSSTFQERVLPGTTPRYVTAQGFYESFVSLGGTLYRSTVHPDRVVEKIGSPVTAYRVTRGTEIKDFDATGRLVRLTDANDGGRTVDLVYTGSLLSEIRTAQGRITTLAYEAGRLSQVGLSDGSTIDYAYDASGNLATVSHGGFSRAYVYAEPDKSASSKTYLLTGIFDETGQRYASFYYDAEGRVTGSHLHSGNGPAEATTVEYTGENSVRVMTDGIGTRTITYSADDYRRPLSVSDDSGTRTSTYSGALVTKSVDKRGIETSYTYTSGFLSSVETAAVTPERKKIAYTRDGLGRVTKTEVSGVLPGQGLRVMTTEKTVYSVTGAVIAACAVDQSVGSASAYVCGSLSVAPVGVRQTLTKYCSQEDVNLGLCPLVGLVVSIDGPRNDVSDITAFHYYMADHPGCATSLAACLWRRADLWKTVDASGASTEALSYDGAARPLSIKDPNGVVSDLEYDANGRLTARTVRSSN